MNIVNIIGMVGAAIILLAFVLNQIGKLDKDDVKYDVANVVGGVLLSAYAYLLGSVPFMVLNIVWTVVSLRDVLRHV